MSSDLQDSIVLITSTEALDKIWQFVDSEQLYGTLLKLGYKQQVRLFRKLVKKYAIAAAATGMKNRRNG